MKLLTSRKGMEFRTIILITLALIVLVVVGMAMRGMMDSTLPDFMRTIIG